MTTYPDDLGTNQTRSLDSANRSFESVVYQRKKPPLSCEVNFTGRLASDHAQDAFRTLSSSGWASIGAIRDSATGDTGDILCSTTFGSNTVKLVGTNSLVAYVNGMKVQVQGSFTTTEDNLITLPAAPTSGARADFVFLEVWRKLIGPTDTVYMNGNTQYGGTNIDNDLIDPSIDIETSLRIQVQYQIRIADCDIQAYPEGFDPNRVFAKGPLAYPLSGSFYFTQVPGDAGLWRSGNGDPASQDLLGTVDGYVYAIPLFVVARRSTESYNPQTRANGAGKTLADYLAGKPSDRPDNKYSDYIVADDILDMRHVLSTNESTKDLCDKAFNKLLRGQLRGKMSKNLNGEDHYGVTLIQPDGISPNDPGWYKKIGTGDGQRRSFANASIQQNLTLVQKTIAQKDVGSSTGPWTSGDSLTPQTGGATINSLDEAYISGSSGVSFLKSPILITSNSSTNYTSTDGGYTWNPQTVPSRWYNKSIVAGDRFLGIFSAPSPNNDEVHYSFDGINWTLLASSASYVLSDIAWNVDAIVTLGSSIIQASFDKGSTWSNVPITTSITRIIWGGNQFVGVGYGGDTITSPDGVTWTEHPAAAGVDYSFSAVMWDGNKYVGVGYNYATSDIFVSTSTNGISWIPSTTPSFPYGYLNSVTRNETTLVAVGSDYSNAIVLTSTDGLTWVAQTSGSTDYLVDISWTGSQFIAIGANSDVLTSSNGVSWYINTLSYGMNSIANCNVSIAGTTAKVTTSSLNSYPITLSYTATFPSSANGFSQLPQRVLEFRPEANDSLPIVSINGSIPVRSQDTTNAYLIYKGGSRTEYYNFGQQMTYYIKGNGTSQVVFPRNLFGYTIVGVASLYDGVGYRALNSVTRNYANYNINSSTFPLGADMTLNLYVGGKFFESSTQGRGITDTFEMSEYIPLEAATGQTVFHIDSTNKAILKIASNEGIGGYGIAYVNGVQTQLASHNSGLPTDSTASMATIEFYSPPAPGSLIEVPVLTLSAIGPTEGYVAYYETLPYQGMLTDEAQGIIEAMGSAIITTAGSGAVTNTVAGVYGIADFISGSNTVNGTGTDWLSTAKPGYTIVCSSYPNRAYTIAQVMSDTVIVLSSPVNFTVTDYSYVIKAPDRAYFNQANIIDRLPALLAANDSSGYSEGFEMGSYYASITDTYPVQETSVRSRVQDIMGEEIHKVHIGVSSADRGRKTIHIDGEDTLGLGNLGLKYESVTSYPSSNYQKTYQSYVINKDSSGELYLMVVGSETDNNSSSKFFNEKSNNDTVDVFRIPGRPISLRKVE